MRDATLVSLVHAPLLAADDLALLCGIGRRGAQRALDARVAAGEAGCVTDPATRRHLYYLTAAGVAVAAPLMRKEPGEVTGRYGLAEGALLHRLPALRRLIAGRRILLHLATALPRVGGTLEAWRAFPVRWPYRRAGRTEILTLDGEATLCFADGVSCVVGYLWDGDPTTPQNDVATRLERLAEVQACPDYAPPSQARVPPVLLVISTAERLPAGYRPGLLWATMASIDAAGPLMANWRSAASRNATVEAHGLRTALDRLGIMAPRPTPGSTGYVVVRGTAPTGPAGLQRRAATVRVASSVEPAHKDLLALSLVLPPRAWPLLRSVGQYPLMDRRTLAMVAGGDIFDTWEVLRLLCRHGLCQVWRPNVAGHGRAWRYSLTTRGTTLLAQSAGLPPLAYRRIHGILDDARSPGERGLSYARENLDHTDGISAAFLAFLTAARERGGTLWWRGEWACTRPYLACQGQGPKTTATLRPDAELHYVGMDGPVRAFVEIDMDSESAEQLSSKVDQYDAYRTWSGDEGFTVLFVTPGPGRGVGPLARARAIARDQRRPPLDVRATTAAALSTDGPWAAIWRDPHGTSCALGMSRSPIHEATGTPRRMVTGKR